MSYKERRKIIEKIEEIRKTKVITYIVSTRSNIDTDIDAEDLRFFYDHLSDERFSGKNIDLFIYSYGGDAAMAWALPNLIRSIGKRFSVLIASYAFSCATSIALGADEIVMTKMGFLGPTDSTVDSDFNPIIRNETVSISVEDIGGYLSLIREKFGITDTENLTRAFEKLARTVKPLALGYAYREYRECRDDIRKLLALHMDPKKEATKIDNIVSILVEKLYSHDHHINREEAREIGLKVKNAETIESDLSQLMWDLFLDYEKEMKLFIPYTDEFPEKGHTVKIILKKIESIVRESTNINEQKWIHLDLPEGCLPTKDPDTDRESLFYPPDQILFLNLPGKLILWDNKVYNVRENIYWK
jgi:hypothetical protein